MVIFSPCLDCKNFNYEAKNNCCKSYPNGIPNHIFWMAVVSCAKPSTRTEFILNLSMRKVIQKKNKTHIRRSLRRAELFYPFF